MKKYMLPILAGVAVLAALLLIPCSPALMVIEPDVLYASANYEPWMAGGFVISVYGVMMAVAAALSIAITAVNTKRTGGSWGGGIALSLISGLGAFILSRVMYTAMQWSYILYTLEVHPLRMLISPWMGGYNMYGAVLGGLLGALLFARWKKQPIAPAMDALAPGLAIMLLLGRAAEAFTGQGLGSTVANEALPMLTVNGDVPVYLFEALAAAAALIIALVMMRGKHRNGAVMETALVIISAAQILLESWRGDELIKFGFVRLNMICAAVMLLGIMVLRLRRAIRADGKWRTWTWLRLALLFVGAAIVILLEFALDKSNLDNTLVYGIMACAVLLMGTVVLLDGGRYAEVKR